MTDSAAASERHSLAINTIRCLSIDMVESADSGHPGAPMGQAALAYRLWTEHMLHHPPDPRWPNRDRFVLSCGHASALLYSLLHLAGYDLPMEELKRFRQLGSKTPGHPEYGLTPGVETTTGPLGQGLANAVGMAIAERLLAQQFNRDGFRLIDHRVWVIAGDGDLMEGVAAEAVSLAGHLGLGKLTVFWDDNRITIEGSTDLTFSEDVCARFAACGWHVIEVDDGNDLDAIDEAALAARAISSSPTLVRVRTHIGFGSPKKQDTSGAHGSPLGPDEALAAKKNLGWPFADQTFHVPADAVEAFAEARERGATAASEWEALFARYAEAHPDMAAQFRARLDGTLPDLAALLPRFEGASVATRKASGKVINAIAAALPQLAGGSADLAGSNNTWIDGEPAFQATVAGRNFHFGVREHAMGAVMNGMALSGLLRPYGGTFLTFSDYMRPAIRLAALMELGAIYIFTHDSIFLGEDGPTHQPVSHILSLRSIPHLIVLRPADANETSAAWKIALEHRHRPSALLLTRQNLPILPGTAEHALENVPRGGYVLADPPKGKPQALLLATGSEVSIVYEAHLALLKEGIRTRVVSMPSWELFDEQDAAYRESVLPSSVKARLAVEAGVAHGWHKYIDSEGATITQDGWGASAPAKDLAEHFGFTAENVARRVREMVGGQTSKSKSAKAKAKA